MSSGHADTLTLSRRIVQGPVLARGSAAPYRALAVAGGEPHLVRDELVGRSVGGRPPHGRPLLCFAHLTDLQLADVQSPARFEFFNREFADPRFAELVPVQRPQEALTAHAVDAMVRALNGVAAGPATGAPLSLVVTTGDAVDNAQWNELVAAVHLLEGGRVRLDSGGPGYQGVQAPWWPDDIFWRPDPSPDRPPDAFRSWFGFPEHPGLLEAAVAAFRAPGLRTPWLACHGNHEALIQGVGRVTPGIAAALVGGRKPFRIAEGVAADDAVAIFTDAVETFMAGDAVEVGADPGRRPVSRREFVEAHFRSGARPDGHGFTGANRAGGTAYYTYDVGPVRFVALDTACVDGGADGSLDRDQLRWLGDELTRASKEDRLVVLVSHHGLATMTNPRCGAGAEEVLRVLHRAGNVVLWLNGHVHANLVRARPDPGRPGHGFWEISTSSIVDWPCQARLVELVDEGDGVLAVVCTMLDHDGVVMESGVRPEGGRWSGPTMAALHRELAANVPIAGAESWRSGTPQDRNVVLRVRASFPLSGVSGELP